MSDVKYRHATHTALVADASVKGFCRLLPTRPMHLFMKLLKEVATLVDTAADILRADGSGGCVALCLCQASSHEGSYQSTQSFGGRTLNCCELFHTELLSTASVKEAVDSQPSIPIQLQTGNAFAVLSEGPTTATSTLSQVRTRDHCLGQTSSTSSPSASAASVSGWGRR